MKALSNFDKGEDVTEVDVQWDVLIGQAVRDACILKGHDPDQVRRDGLLHVSGSLITASYYKVDVGICLEVTLERSMNSLDIVWK